MASCLLRPLMKLIVSLMKMIVRASGNQIHTRGGKTGKLLFLAIHFQNQLASSNLLIFAFDGLGQSHCRTVQVVIQTLSNWSFTLVTG